MSSSAFSWMGGPSSRAPPSSSAARRSRSWRRISISCSCCSCLCSSRLRRGPSTSAGSLSIDDLTQVETRENRFSVCMQHEKRRRQTQYLMVMVTSRRLSVVMTPVMWCRTAVRVRMLGAELLHHGWISSEGTLKKYEELLIHQ